MNLDEEWEKYKQDAYRGNEIPEDQDRECRSAFMAGCAFMLKAVTECCTDDELESVEQLRQIHQELFRESSEVLKRENPTENQ